MIWRGPKVPSFISHMDHKLLHAAIDEALENNEAFLVDLEIKEGNKILLFVDADNGITVQQLKMINRQVEAAFDRDIEDFDLTVSSPGLDRPFKVKRQYTNNVGRWVKVKLNDGEIVIGQLIDVNENEMTLSVPPVKKKEESTERLIAFANVEETKIEIRFTR